MLWLMLDPSRQQNPRYASSDTLHLSGISVQSYRICSFINKISNCPSNYRSFIFIMFYQTVKLLNLILIIRIPPTVSLASLMPHEWDKAM